MKKAIALALGALLAMLTGLLRPTLAAGRTGATPCW